MIETLVVKDQNAAGIIAGILQKGGAKVRAEVGSGVYTLAIELPKLFETFQASAVRSSYVFNPQGWSVISRTIDKVN